jgi:exopolysaccharide production protein ExoZ
VMFGRRLGLPTAMEGYWTDPIIINFIFGMAIGYAYRLGFRLPLIVGLILAALAVVNFVHVFAYGTYGLPIRVAIGLSGAMAVSACAFSFPQTSFGLLKYPILWIGDWSYATYLTHGFTLRVCWNYGLSVPVTLAWILVVSAVAYWVIERPAHVLGRKLLRVGRSEPRQAAALPA